MPDDRPAGRTGVIFILSSPSGGGKTTLLRMVRARLAGIVDSVSYTTRPRRPGERDGVDYHFLERTSFQERAAKGFFAEWAEVHGHLYGTSREDLAGITGRGQDAIMDIDVQGARQMKAAFPGAVTVFILPPSLDELERRLRQRGTDDEATIARRLDAARREMDSLADYDYLLVNRDAVESAAQLEAIIAAERLRTARLDPALLLAAILRAGG